MTKKSSQDEKLRAQYRKSCQFIEGHLRHQGANAVGIQQAGKRIAWIQRHGAFRYDNFDTFDQWREAKLKFSAEWAAKYMTIGASYTVLELQGKQLGVQALAAIARMDDEYRPTLLQYGQRHEATVLRAAYKRAKACSSVDKGKAVLKAVLERPEPDEKGRTRVSSASLPLPQHIQRCKRHLTTLVSEVRGVRQRLAGGEELPADERVSFGSRLEEVVRELWDLNKVISGRPADAHAGPTIH